MKFSTLGRLRKLRGIETSHEEIVRMLQKKKEGVVYQRSAIGYLVAEATC